MMRVFLFLFLLSLSLSLLCLSIDASFPTVDFTSLLRTYATSTSTDNTWCKKCPAFSMTPCAMGCAGDAGGGPCPPEACPRAYTFPLVNNQPIWNVQVATAGDPYRAFSYIPLCTQAGQCTESFIFSFSVKFTPAGANAAQTSNFFSQQRDYLKLLFWGDGNNILGVKNGQLLGFPNGGSADLVGTNGIGSGHAFAAPFSRDVWTHIGVQFNVNNGRTSLAFFLNGVSIGSTDKTIGIQNSGLQFGAYVWNGAFFTLQYKDIAITKTLPIISNGATATTATPTTKAPTPTPTVTPKPTQAATPRPVVTAVPPSVSATTAPPTSPPVTQGFPNIDFTSLLQKYATSTDGTWCTKCSPNFQQPTQSTCSMGCAGDTGGGGACPASACPRLFTFPIVNNEPIWNINVQTAGDPYRAFSYIPICTQAGQCTESFFFSFSFKYIPDASTSTSAQTEFFSQQRDYLKMLFWGDGNNILGVKNGQLLGFPNGGIVDLVGTNGIGSGHAFATPFISDVWTHVGIQFNVQNGRTSLAFFLNGIATGTTTGEVGVSQFGLQFGAYVWNGATFTLQYKDITITKNLPTIGGTTPIPATPTGAVTEQPPLDDTTDPPTSTDPDTPSTIATSKPTSLPTNSGPSMAIYDTATVARHNQASDCWTILDGIVFDISKLVFIHPGGIQIKSYCGKDCSIIFSASHTNDAADRALLAKSYLKGTLGSMTTSKPTNPTVINVGDSRYNQATTITSSLLCMMISLIVAVVLEYLI